MAVAVGLAGAVAVEVAVLVAVAWAAVVAVASGEDWATGGACLVGEAVAEVDGRAAGEQAARRPAPPAVNMSRN